MIRARPSLRAVAFLGACSQPKPDAAPTPAGPPAPLPAVSTGATPPLGAAPATSASATLPKMPDTPARASSCTLPDTPADLVLRAERTVIPIGGDPSREGAEVTARGTCAAGIECVKVTDAELAEAYRLFQTATGVRHADTRMSPHYGSRTLTARWGTSECSVGDGQQSPVEKADWDTYYAAFDAIIGLAVHGRPDGGVGP